MRLCAGCVPWEDAFDEEKMLFGELSENSSLLSAAHDVEGGGEGAVAAARKAIEDKIRSKMSMIDTSMVIRDMRATATMVVTAFYVALNQMHQSIIDVVDATQAREADAAGAASHHITSTMPRVIVLSGVLVDRWSSKDHSLDELVSSVKTLAKSVRDMFEHISGVFSRRQKGDTGVDMRLALLHASIQASFKRIPRVPAGALMLSDSIASVGSLLVDVKNLLHGDNVNRAADGGTSSSQAFADAVEVAKKCNAEFAATTLTVMNTSRTSFDDVVTPLGDMHAVLSQLVNVVAATASRSASATAQESIEGALSKVINHCSFFLISVRDVILVSDHAQMTADAKDGDGVVFSSKCSSALSDVVKEAEGARATLSRVTGDLLRAIGEAGPGVAASKEAIKSLKLSFNALENSVDVATEGSDYYDMALACARNGNDILGQLESLAAIVKPIKMDDLAAVDAARIAVGDEAQLLSEYFRSLTSSVSSIVSLTLPPSATVAELRNALKVLSSNTTRLGDVRSSQGAVGLLAIVRKHHSLAGDWMRRFQQSVRDCDLDSATIKDAVKSADTTLIVMDDRVSSFIGCLQHAAEHADASGVLETWPMEKAGKAAEGAIRAADTALCQVLVTLENEPRAHGTDEDASDSKMVLKAASSTYHALTALMPGVRDFVAGKMAAQKFGKLVGVVQRGMADGAQELKRAVYTNAPAVVALRRALREYEQGTVFDEVTRVVAYVDKKKKKAKLQTSDQNAHTAREEISTASNLLSSAVSTLRLRILADPSKCSLSGPEFVTQARDLIGGAMSVLEIMYSSRVGDAARDAAVTVAEQLQLLLSTRVIKLVKVAIDILTEHAAATRAQLAAGDTKFKAPEHLAPLDACIEQTQKTIRDLLLLLVRDYEAEEVAAAERLLGMHSKLSRETLALQGRVATLSFENHSEAEAFANEHESPLVDGTFSESLKAIGESVEVVKNTAERLIITHGEALSEAQGGPAVLEEQTLAGIVADSLALDDVVLPFMVVSSSMIAKTIDDGDFQTVLHDVRDLVEFVADLAATSRDLTSPDTLATMANTVDPPATRTALIARCDTLLADVGKVQSAEGVVVEAVLGMATLMLNFDTASIAANSLHKRGGELPTDDAGNVVVTVVAERAELRALLLQCRRGLHKIREGHNAMILRDLACAPDRNT